MSARPIPRTPGRGRLLTEVEAAWVLDMKSETLRFWRMNGDQRRPPHVEVSGSVYYQMADLDDLLDRRGGHA